MKEILTKRGLREKHFDLGNGNKRLHVFASPIHFKKDGKWVDKSEFQVSAVNGEIVNNSDKLNVKIKNYKVKVGNSSFEILGLAVDDVVFEEPKGIGVLEGNSVWFRDIFDGVDIRYDLEPHNIREWVIYKKNPLKGKNISGSRIGIKFDIKGKLPKTYDNYGVDGKGIYLPVANDKTIPTTMLATAMYPLEIDPNTKFVEFDSASAGLVRAAGAYEAKVNDPATVVVGTYGKSKDGNGTYHGSWRRAYVRYDLSSLTLADTINTATHYLYVSSSYPMYLRQVTAEVDPSTATSAQIYTNSAGTAIASISTGTGWKTSDVKTYCTTHRGGYADFGILGTEDDSNNETTYLSTIYITNATYETYIQIDYTTGVPIELNMPFGDFSFTGYAPTVATNYYRLNDREWVLVKGVPLAIPDGKVLTPIWDTVGRPSTPSAGQYGYNRDTGEFEIYNGSAWKIYTDAYRYDDIVFEMTPSRLGINTKPDWDATNKGFLFPQGNTTEYIDIIVQMPHSWQTGTTIYPHIHAITTQGGQAVFKADYKWYNIGDTVPANASTYTMNTYSHEWSSGNLHTVIKGTGIDGTGKGISSILQLRLYRDDNVYTGDILVKQFDIHIIIDSFGSRTEYSK